jgi:hypothetical protein
MELMFAVDNGMMTLVSIHDVSAMHVNPDSRLLEILCHGDGGIPKFGLYIEHDPSVA